MIWNSGCHSPALRGERDAGVGDEQAVDDDVVASRCRACRACARSRATRHLRRLHRHAEMQHLGRVSPSRIAPVISMSPASRARGEDLARGDAVAALDLLGLAGAADPVRAAAGQQHDLLGGDALQQRLDGRDLLVAPAPGRDGDLVRVHGEGERRSSRRLRDHADHVAEFGDLGAAPAEFDAARRPRRGRPP